MIEEPGATDDDEGRVRELAAGIDLESSLGITEFGQGARCQVARTVDAALQVLSACDAHAAADAAARLLDDLSPAPRQARGGLWGLLAGRQASAGRQAQALTTGWVTRAETALKLRQVALIKERCVLERLVADAQREERELGLASRAARMRAETEPGHARRLTDKADQLELSRMAAAQVAAALTLLCEADETAEQALASVVEHALPAWHDIAERHAAAGTAGTGELQALAKAEEDADGVAAVVGERLYTARKDFK